MCVMFKITAKYNLSFWESTTFFKDIDYLIVGSGIVGLSAAIELKKKQPSKKVIVLERGALPIGASTRNAGFACYGSMTELIDDMKSTNPADVWQLVERRWKGLLALRELLGDENIAYENTGGFEIFDEQDDTYARCMDRRTEFNQMLFEITGVKEMYEEVSRDIPSIGLSGISAMIKNKGEGLLHTGKMMDALLRKAQSLGVDIYFGTAVMNMEESNQGVTVQTGQGWKIITQQIIIATNGFAKELIPDVDLRPARNQVLVTSPISNLNLRGGYHYNSGYYYFRNIGNRILLGGARNIDLEAETTAKLGLTNTILDELTRFLRETICLNENPVIEYTWSGIMGVGAEKAPIVKRLSNHIVLAVRLGGMGVAIGCLVGREAVAV